MGNSLKGTLLQTDLNPGQRLHRVEYDYHGYPSALWEYIIIDSQPDKITIQSVHSGVHLDLPVEDSKVSGRVHLSYHTQKDLWDLYSEDEWERSPLSDLRTGLFLTHQARLSTSKFSDNPTNEHLLEARRMLTSLIEWRGLHNDK